MDFPIYDSSGARLLTLAQVAEVRGVGISAVRMARQRGTLPEPAGWLDARTPLWRELEVARMVVPAELASLDRWVRRSEHKVPLTVSGQVASSTYEGSWSSFREAAKSQSGVGVGFVLNGDGIVCIDIDHCVVDGKLAEVAAAIVERCQGTWVEISPSGAGLHVWGRADLAKGFRRNGVEVYPNGRYIAVTGKSWMNAPLVLADISEVVAAL